MNEQIHILLPVHNRRAVTERFVDALLTQSYTNYHLLLIDDGSTDDTDQMVRTKIKNTTVLRGSGNWWWAGSLQQGINWLEKNAIKDQEIILFANDDITFDKDFLKEAVRILNGLKNSLLLPYLRDEKTGMPQESGVEADLRNLTFTPAASQDKINCLPTRGLFMRMADLRRIGGFYPRLLPHYLSDYEFTIRAHRYGLHLCTTTDLVISLDRTQTGHRNFDDTKFITFLKQYFSKKSASNPIYFSSFVLLSNSFSEMPKNYFKIWRNSAALIISKIRLSLSTQKDDV